MFEHYSGPVRVQWWPKAASQVFANGDLVYADGSGAIIPADATSGDHLGVIIKDIAATDDDYTSNTMVPVIVPTEDTLFTVDVGTGTFTTAMVGNRYDLKDANEIDVSATSKKVVTIVKYISATKAVVKINAMVSAANVATS